MNNKQQSEKEFESLVKEIRKAAEDLATNVKDVFEDLSTDKIRGFEVVSDKFRKFLERKITLPTRGSKDSSGYDFYSNESCEIQPGEKHVFFTDVKAYMKKGEVLKIYVRSSIGIKKDLILSNVVGIIDQDYYQNVENEGNVIISLRNLGNTTAKIEEGERIAQGIFEKFLESDQGNSKKERTGGVGSTNG